jgi:CIC family chloride channel protein
VISVRRPQVREPASLLLLAVAVGAIGGLGAMAFHALLGWSLAAFAWPARAAGLTGGWLTAWRMVAPALGLLAVGALTRRFARELRGHGVPQVLDALALQSGRIPARVAAFGAVIPAITIGAGNSVGDEGPIALIGAAFGSVAGQLLRLSEPYLGVLIGCGVAGGIGAIFNAPLAGAFFAVEIVLGSYAIGTMVPVLVAGVTGVALVDYLQGNRLALPAPPYQFAHPGGVAFMLLLGLLAGLAGLVYARGIYFAEDAFAAWRAPAWFKNAAGGLALGVMGVLYPQVTGLGYDVVARVIVSPFPFGLLLALLVLKYLATIVTLGAGGSGGVVAPSIYAGAMLGGLFGYVVHGLLPGITSEVQVYVVAGLGAVFAAAAQAPLTGIAIALEATGDYRLTVGIVGACAISYLVYGSLRQESMYTVKLAERGISIHRGAAVRPLQRVVVSAAMQPVRAAVPAGTPVKTAQDVLARSGEDALLVLTPAGGFFGVLRPAAIVAAIGTPAWEGPVEAIADTGTPVVFSDETLDDALRRFGIYATEVLPVADRRAPDRPVGVLSRTATLAAYYSHTMSTLVDRARAETRLAAGGAPGGLFREVVLPPDSAWVGHPLREVAPPPDVVLVSVTRGGQPIVPRGDTVLEPGDRILLYAADAAALERDARLVNGGPARASQGASVTRRGPR